MKIIAKYFGLFVSTLGALVIFVLIIVWGVSLPQTAVLWNGGPVQGWAFLILFAIVSAAATFSPALFCYPFMDE